MRLRKVWKKNRGNSPVWAVRFTYNMELIAISHPEFIPNESERINALFRAGLMRLHIRKPHCNVADLSQLIGEIDPAFHANIALHSHHELAAEFGIKRLHFPEKLRQETPDFMLE